MVEQEKIRVVYTKYVDNSCPLILLPYRKYFRARYYYVTLITVSVSETSLEE